MSDLYESHRDLWKLAADLSVVDAAILVAGGDPAEVDTDYDQYFEARTEMKRTSNHPGYDAVFSALTAAILRGYLPAQMAFNRVGAGMAEDECWVLSSRAIYDRLDGTDDNPFDYVESIHIRREPDWSKTTIDVEDLKVWLKSRGFTDSFFFPPQEDDGSDEFMNPGHEHFAPELALAITAWQALLPERTFKGGVKAAIEAWIAANPDAWQGENPISGGAIERIATLVNWNKSGGAPRSNG